MPDWPAPSPSWRSVEAAQKQVDEISKQVLALPIAELRKLGYRPPPLPQDVPNPGKDIDISTIEITVRDSTKVPLRLYKRKIAGADADADAPLFFDIHGGGWVLGTPETEEAQNRMIALKNRVVVCLENSTSLGIDAHKIIIGGGSAGANLTAALALKARAEGITDTIIGQILNIPVTCHPELFPREKFPYMSYEQKAAGPIVDAWKMNWFWAQYSRLPARKRPRTQP
ncbi:hypothetical protein LTS15_010567 [Exophiala xenobiotica]|nr:hypothetical protein LTS15_010567 [Exophiala xenobiotica]